MTTSLYNLKLAALLWAPEHSALLHCFIVLNTCIVSGPQAVQLQHGGPKIKEKAYTVLYTEYNQKNLVFWFRN